MTGYPQFNVKFSSECAYCGKSYFTFWHRTYIGDESILICPFCVNSNFGREVLNHKEICAPYKDEIITESLRELEQARLTEEDLFEKAKIEKEIKKKKMLVRKKQVNASFDLEQIKSNVTACSILEEPKSKGGGRMFFNCPLHKEDTPSFIWYEKSRSWYCFGCGEGGDIVSLYMKINNCDFISACRSLQPFV